jgi:hypothetical protein
LRNNRFIFIFRFLFFLLQENKKIVRLIVGKYYTWKFEL